MAKHEVWTKKAEEEHKDAVVQTLVRAGQTQADAEARFAARATEPVSIQRYRLAAKKLVLALNAASGARIAYRKQV